MKEVETKKTPFSESIQIVPAGKSRNSKKEVANSTGHAPNATIAMNALQNPNVHIHFLYFSIQ